MFQSQGLAYWSAAIFERTKLDDDAYARMVAHPRFSNACRLTAQNFLDRIANTPLMRRALTDVSRMIYAVLALYLDARGGLTVTGIQELCAELGLVSPGGAAIILTQLRLKGYVERDPVQPDRRVRRYIPTADMATGFRDFFRSELFGLSLIEPEVLPAAERFDEPEMVHAYILMFGRGLARTVARGEKTPITPFVTRNAGMAILYQIALSAEEGDTYPPRGPLHMSVAGLARKFDVSRSHVLRMLREAESMGLMRRNADEMTGTMEEPLREALNHFHAANLIWNAHCAHYALEYVAGRWPRIAP